MTEAVERIYQPMWDTAQLPVWDNPAPYALTLFQAPIGHGGRCEEDTSMYLAGQMPAGNALYVVGVEVYFNPSQGIGVADRAATVHVLTRGLLEFRVGNRRMLAMSPLAALKPSFPMYAAYDDEKLREILVARAWTGEGDSFKRTDKGLGFEITPVYIQPHQPFSVGVSFRDLCLQRRGKLGVILNAYLERQAQ